MLKVLIVDDEMLVRMNLASLINWEENGFVICGEASNGKNALEKIEQLHPHIVIMDIAMPVMNGVELSYHISQKHKNIKMIVLSSYADFDYVRETLKNGAMDYILKHLMDAPTLLSVLNKAKSRIEEEMRRETERVMAEKQLEAAAEAINENYIRQLLLGIKSDTEDSYNPLQTQLCFKDFIVVAMQVFNYLIMVRNYSGKDEDLLIQSIINVCKQVIRETGQGIIVYLRQGRFALIFSCEGHKSEAYIYRQIQNCMERISAALKTYLDIEVVWGSSGPGGNCMDLPEYFRRACDIMNERMNLKIYNEKNRFDDREVTSLNINQEKKLLTAIDMKDIDQIQEILDDIFNELHILKASYDSIQIITTELLTIALKAGKDFGIESQSIYDRERHKIEYFRQEKRIESIHKWIKDVYSRLIELAKAKYAPDIYSQYVRDAMLYMRNHYKEDISLQDVSEAVGISPSYLSRLFREETGQSFVFYLNNIRIEMAKKLIDEGEKNIKTLYKKVGFNSYNYFFSVFKEVTGYTPLTYMKKGKGEPRFLKNS